MHDFSECSQHYALFQVYLHFYLTQGNEEVLTDFAENKLLIDQQHSFTSGRSCITQLLTTIDVWMELLEKKKEEKKQWMLFKKSSGCCLFGSEQC